MGKVGWTVAFVGAALLLLISSAGPFLAIVWVGVCAGVAKAIKTGETQVSPRSTPTSTGRPRLQNSVHRPPGPVGVPVEPWSPQTEQHEVAGEWFQRENVQLLFKPYGGVKAEGSELEFTALLVPDSRNPHDPNAVAVFVQGLHVGYLERDNAVRYAPTLAGMTAAGQVLVVRSRQWARSTGDQFYARVTLHLPHPDGINPRNSAPHGGRALAVGSAIQVTKEDAHMDVLAPLLAKYGAGTSLAATLYEVVEVRPRSTVEVVEVRIDGDRVGVLSPTQTSNLLPVVRHVEQRGRVPFCRASIRGNPLKADVTLYVRKAQDLSEEDLQELAGES